LENFGSQLHGSRICDSGWATLSERPIWVSYLQGAVTLSSFSGNIEATRVNNLPTIAGEKGDKGDSGDPGLKGDKGDTGQQGIRGLRAIKVIRDDKVSKV